MLQAWTELCALDILHGAGVMVGASNKLAPLIYLKLKSRRKHKRTTWHIIYDSKADGESNVFRGTSTSFKVLLRIAFQESINSESLIVCVLWSANWVCYETMTMTLKNLLNCVQLTEMTAMHQNVDSVTVSLSYWVLWDGRRNPLRASAENVRPAKSIF